MSESKPSGTAKKWVITLIILASVGWTIYNWSGLARVKEELSGVLLVFVLLLVSEACFVIGAVLMLVSTGKSLRGTSGWFAGIREVRKNVQFVAQQITLSHQFRIGFNLNWFGAVFTGVILLTGIVFVLPTTAWGLTILPILDIVASFGWRLPIDRKIRALKEAS